MSRQDTGYEQAVLGQITSIMATQHDSQCKPLRWFFCFGTLQEYICDLTFHMNFDIDIGIPYEDYQPAELINAWEGFGFSLQKKIVNDLTGKPFNLQFKAVQGSYYQNMPTIDIYAWFRHKDIVYHTYDIDREDKDKPTKYTFKGAKAEWLYPSQNKIDRVRRSAPEMDQIMDEGGIWNYDIFGDHSGYKFRCPFAYGSLLDCWDPGWRFRDAKRGQSKTPWMQRMKSCAEWEKV